MKHRKPAHTRRVLVHGSCSLITAVALATFVGVPAAAQEHSPTPSQPGVTSPDEPGAGGDRPLDPSGPTQPGVTPPQTPDDEATPPELATPQQPGVTPPRQAPLPVPGDNGDTPQDTDPEWEADDHSAASPDAGVTEEETPPQTAWQAPRTESAPAAPVVEMTGPHTELAGNIDAGPLAPGFAANGHYFSNPAGHAVTVGYRTPAGEGEVGASVEFVDSNTFRVSGFAGGAGLDDRVGDAMVDVTELNTARIAVEHWIRQQPGGAEALAALEQQPPVLPEGDIEPQTLDVGGATAEWGGSVQY
ncbi:hypothetical protein HLB23_09915 [Nocardia uniformis]|uniref:Uncharacterized protein n=1 Tax=Nocardia uniformis TaxID=53432 RepID=A0A849BU79_9NOCA|nr:hypothetical protein [Nocardia uniformis]NNH70172.1 hypothetical protein [Nocardia uniformis]